MPLHEQSPGFYTLDGGPAEVTIDRQQTWEARQQARSDRLLVEERQIVLHRVGSDPRGEQPQLTLADPSVEAAAERDIVQLLLHQQPPYDLHRNDLAHQLSSERARLRRLDPGSQQARLASERVAGMEAELVTMLNGTLRALGANLVGYWVAVGDEDAPAEPRGHYRVVNLIGFLGVRQAGDQVRAVVWGNETSPFAMLAKTVLGVYRQYSI